MRDDLKKQSCVYVVDDDAAIRRNIGYILEAGGYPYRVFESAIDFLKARLELVEASCLVLDIRMPGMSGIELQNCLPGSDHEMPIVFVSAYGDVPICVQTMKAGAVSFLLKPFRMSELLTAVDEALDSSREWHEREDNRLQARRRYLMMTPREREVSRFVVSGMLNKQIAAEMEIAECTVKIHRARVMEKVGVESVAELVRFSLLLPDEYGTGDATGPNQV